MIEHVSIHPYKKEADIPKYTYENTIKHIRKKHPNCPSFAVEFFASEVASKKWENASIGKAVGITMQNYLRHHMTDYDCHLLNGMDRSEARARVQPRIAAMLAIWQRKDTGTPER